jgi:ABC-2 type transport system permease protein
MTHLRALLAVTARNLKIALRRPDLLIQTMAVPVVVLGLAAIIFGASDAWPIAVIDQSRSPESRTLTRALAETRGATGPYFRTYTTNEDEAERLLSQGRLHLVVAIPPDFATTKEIQTRTYNINTDAMKNVRLRLSTMANLDDRLSGVAGVTGRIDKVSPVDVTRTAFMGGSAVIIALLLGAALISANLYAVDTEHRTRTEMALTPVGTQHAASGAALAGSLLSVLTAVPTLALALAFGTRATAANITQAGLVVLPAALAAAGLGVLTAISLRTHRLIQPTIILLVLGSYFASGGFVPVASLPPVARELATWWPVSYVFEWSNPVLHDIAAGPSSMALTAPAVAVVVALASALIAARRDHLGARSHGQ